jgi:hypothetical protein
MANPCYTCVTLFGDNKCINELYKNLRYFLKKESSNTSDLKALGNKYGLDIDEHGIFNHFDDKVSEDDDGISYFEVQIETRWIPKTDILDGICKYYKNKIDYVYLAEEPGCEVFINTDKDERFYSTRFYLSLEGDELSDYDSEYYFDSWSELVEKLKEIFSELIEYEFTTEEKVFENPDKEIKNLNKIIENIIEENDADCSVYISFYSFI